MKKYKNRDEVPEKYKWDLTEYYKDDKDFEKNLKETEEEIKKISSYKGCTKDAEKLYEYLVFDTKISCAAMDLYAYAMLRNDEILGVSSSIERYNKTIALYGKLEVESSFFKDELLSLDKKEYEKLFTKNPKLKEYKELLDSVYREKEHVLTENEENIITRLSNSADNFSEMSATLINSEHDYGKVMLDGVEETLTTTNYIKFLKNSNRDTRRDAYFKLNNKLREYATTSASLLNSYVKLNSEKSKIHKFNSAWERKLFHLNLNEKVFDTLIKTTEENLDVLHRYFKLRKKILKLDKMYSYDLNKNLAHNNKEYSIETAQNIIGKALAPLGKDYLEKYDKIIKERRIDYCQYKGKTSGGYNMSTNDKSSRILMSFNYNLDSVSTIAHEAGHNVHHEFINDNNPLQYRGMYSIVTEVVSLTNECLLSDYLFKNGETKEERLAGLENIIDVIISNLFGAVREGAMELDFYKYVESGNTITKDYIDKLSHDYIKKYYGTAVELDENSGNIWIRRSHYYMDFYLLSYAICISVATFIADKITNGDKDMLDKYLKFIKIGDNKWPNEIFEELDINLEDKEVYQNAINYFDKLLDKFEKTYNEL